MATADEIQQTAIQLAQDMASSMQETAAAAAEGGFPEIADAGDLLSGLEGVTELGWGGFNAPSASLPSVSAARPVAPSLLNITMPELGAAPTFSMAEPIISIPTAPSSALPGAPGDAPSFNVPALPDKPAFTLPTAPTFANIAIPEAPSFEVPTFSTALPVDDIVAPSEVFAFAEQPYQSAMLDSLKVKLMQDLSNGGYGIEPADEQALWERARERELRGADVAIQELARSFASRGLSMPSGAMAAAMQRTQQALMEKNSSLSREITLKRADMYVENRKFTIQQAKDVEQMLIQYTGLLAERALNAAKAMVELGIAVFNAKVAKYNVKLEAYKAAAQVYESLIRGAMLQLESYKTKVEGARLSAEVQRIHADVYRIQLDGVNTLVNLYTAEANAAKILVDIEQSKLDAFRTQVETYTAQVGAKTAEFGMFEAQIKGEVSKLAAYETSVKAYATNVDAYKSRAEASDVVLRAQVAANSARLEAYKADIARYSAELEASRAALSGAVAKHEADIKGFAVSGELAIKGSEVTLAASKANADVATARAKIAGDFMIAKAGVLTEQVRTLATVNGHLASAFGSVAAGAMGSALGIVSEAK